jgi:hypothetical protein
MVFVTVLLYHTLFTTISVIISFTTFNFNVLVSSMFCTETRGYFAPIHNYLVLVQKLSGNLAPAHNYFVPMQKQD